MKRLVLAILLVTGVAAASVFLVLTRPGAEASPGATIVVENNGDANSRDGVISLREAMLLAIAHLDRDSDRLNEALYHLRVGRPPLAGAIQGDDVRASSASFLPGTGHGRRVVAEHGLPPEVTLIETDTAAATDIDGGDYLHASPELAAGRRNLSGPAFSSRCQPRQQN
jgi:hypothetical protein